MKIKNIFRRKKFDRNWINNLDKKWVVWGGFAILKEDVLSGKQWLGYKDHILTKEEIQSIFQ